ncbi:RidA family protein [Brevibacterium salitolerans]|uniref:RidA family protein n=1 Tax=Brevibacterium salitolerans TaxID=1403566 RepID=A0ABN2X9E7_9MICO
MTASMTERLAHAQITLPEPAAPAATYEPARQVGNLLFISGQLPLQEGALVATGRVGAEVELADAQRAAACCAANVLAQAQRALGDLDSVRAISKITVFVASAPEFTDQHLVANGASDFLLTGLGELGRHSRSAVGVASLPMNAAVEVEAVLEVS